MFRHTLVDGIELAGGDLRRKGGRLALGGLRERGRHLAERQRRPRQSDGADRPNVRQKGPEGREECHGVSPEVDLLTRRRLCGSLSRGFARAGRARPEREQ